MLYATRRALMHDSLGPRVVDGLARSRLRLDGDAGMHALNSRVRDQTIRQNTMGRVDGYNASGYVMDVVAQPPSNARLNQALRTPIAIRLRRSGSHAPDTDSDFEDGRLLAVATLVTCGSDGAYAPSGPDALAGPRLFDSIHAVDGEPDEVIGYASFDDLAVRQPGMHQIRIALIRVISGQGETTQIVDTRAFIVRTPGISPQQLSELSNLRLETLSDQPASTDGAEPKRPSCPEAFVSSAGIISRGRGRSLGNPRNESKNELPSDPAFPLGKPARNLLTDTSNSKRILDTSHQLSDAELRASHRETPREQDTAAILVLSNTTVSYQTKRVVVDRLMKSFYELFDRVPQGFHQSETEESSSLGESSLCSSEPEDNLDSPQEEPSGAAGSGDHTQRTPVNGTSTAASNGELLSSPKFSTSEKHKRSRDDEDREGGGKRPKDLFARPSELPNPAKRLACPFYKRFPTREPKHTSCLHPGFISIHRVKEHLYRRHLRSTQIRCPRCYEIFKDESLLRSHATATERCPEAEERPEEEGLSQDQVKLLKSRKKLGLETSEETKWRQIFRICFPDVLEANFPSPYCNWLETSPSQQLDHFERFERERLPVLVRQELEIAVETDPNLSRLEESVRLQLVDIIRNCQNCVYEEYRDPERTLAHELARTPEGADEQMDEPRTNPSVMEAPLQREVDDVGNDLPQQTQLGNDALDFLSESGLADWSSLSLGLTPSISLDSVWDSI